MVKTGFCVFTAQFHTKSDDWVKKAFVFLDKKIISKEGLEHLPSPCEDDLESDTEHPEFGQEDVTERS